jgi:hypothetical protein
MLKAITVVAAVATAGAAFTSMPAQADDGRIAAGVVGGLAAGAMLGAAASSGYDPYYSGPAYYHRSYQPVYGACHWERERIVDAYGRMIVRRVRVCD